MNHQITVGIVRRHLCLHCNGNVLDRCRQAAQCDNSSQRSCQILLANLGSLCDHGNSVFCDLDLAQGRLPCNSSIIIRQEGLSVFQCYAGICRNLRFDIIYTLPQKYLRDLLHDFFFRQRRVPDFQIVYGRLRILASSPVRLSDLKDAAVSQNICQRVRAVHSCLLDPVYIDRCISLAQHSVNMRPLSSDSSRRIGRTVTASYMIVTLHRQVAVLMQESDIVFASWISLGGIARRRIERPVCSCPVVFDIVRDCHLLQPGQKTSSLFIRNSEPLRGRSVQMKRCSGAFIAVLQSISAGGSRRVSHYLLTVRQIIKIKIQQKIRLRFRRRCGYGRKVRPGHSKGQKSRQRLFPRCFFLFHICF